MHPDADVLLVDAVTGDFARIVVETGVDLREVERYLAEVHPEMLPVLKERVQAAKNPPAAPERPKRRR